MMMAGVLVAALTRLALALVAMRRHRARGRMIHSIFMRFGLIGAEARPHNRDDRKKEQEVPHARSVSGR